MADYEDGEEEALGWWMMAILKATKNMARNKQKNEGGYEVWGQKITFITDISYAFQ